jgi:two-component system, cell cycle response regulator
MSTGFPDKSDKVAVIKLRQTDDTLAGAIIPVDKIYHSRYISNLQQKSIFYQRPQPDVKSGKSWSRTLPANVTPPNNRQNMIDSHILIVDDDPDVRAPLEEFILQSGFSAVTASSAEEAMKVLASDSVNIVITDISLPGMDGLEFTDRIKKNFDVDVIVITGYSAEYSYEEAINKGASDLLFKPVRLGEMILRIKRVLKERRLNQERIRMLGELKNLAITDGLTRLYNSRHFYSQVELEIDRSLRYRHPLSLMLFDIDHFKVFNDTYGHLEGDKVLFRISQTAKSCLRTMDTAYRYGGEEFTVILPETVGREGMKVGERIRAAIEKEKFIQNSNIITITISVGVTQYVFNESVASFIKRADQAMYLSKQKGRNRVSLLT